MCPVNQQPRCSFCGGIAKQDELDQHDGCHAECEARVDSDLLRDKLRLEVWEELTREAV